MGASAEWVRSIKAFASQGGHKTRPYSWTRLISQFNRRGDPRGRPRRRSLKKQIALIFACFLPYTQFADTPGRIAMRPYSKFSNTCWSANLSAEGKHQYYPY
jgi:hypothetical protein